MGRRGPGALPQAEKREQFARLIAQGFNNSEARRLVGINRRTGKRAATDILTLAGKGRAFSSLDALIARQGGQHVLYGSALALTAALQAWSRHAGTPVPDLARSVIR
jgi:hypothetical protein